MNTQLIIITLSISAGVVVVVVSIAFATSVSDEVEVVDVGKATASSQAQWEIFVYKDQLVSKAESFYSVKYGSSNMDRQIFCQIFKS